MQRTMLGLTSAGLKLKKRKLQARAIAIGKQAADTQGIIRAFY